MWVEKSRFLFHTLPSVVTLEEMCYRRSYNTEGVCLAIKAWPDVSASFRKQIWKWNRKLTKLTILGEKREPQFLLNAIVTNKYYFQNNTFNIFWLRSKGRHFPKVTHYSSGNSDSQPFSSDEICLKILICGKTPLLALPVQPSLSGCSEQ